MKLSVPLVLASRSPRRKRLLKQLNLSFLVQESPAEESMSESASPEVLVQELAVQKVTPVASQHPEALTLAADTVVSIGDTVLGKPADETEAYRMLRTLSANVHTVYTGLVLSHPASDRRVSAVEQTDVYFGELSDAEIEAYIATRSPFDKAGGYGIQDDMGALFVERIDGDYYNVVGLPLRRFYLLLQQNFSDFVSL